MKHGSTICLVALMAFAGTAGAAASVEVDIHNNAAETDHVETGATSATNSLAAGSGSGAGVADLSAGLLRLNATAPAYDPGHFRDDTQVIAQFSDTLIFSPDASGVAYLNYHIDGVLSVPATVDNQVTNSAYATLGIAVAADDYGRLADFGDVFTDTNCGPFAEPRCHVGTSFSEDGGVAFALGAGRFDIQIDLAGSTFNGGSANFSNTALFSLTLPAGVTYTSDSGAFLATASPVAAAVPEPSTFALVGAGLALAVGAARRRRGVPPVGFARGAGCLGPNSAS